jgi:hypothetical protein
MSEHILVEIEMPASLEQFRLPPAVNERLQKLLDRQDRGETLTSSERKEAEGLVDLAEFLSLLRLRAQRISANLIPQNELHPGQAAATRHRPQQRSLRILPFGPDRSGGGLPY